MAGAANNWPGACVPLRHESDAGPGWRRTCPPSRGPPFVTHAHKHLNNSIMSRLSSSFADTLRACNAEPESNAVHQQMLMFFKCVLLGTGWEVAQRRKRVSIVRRRLDRWQEGQRLQLWSEARDGAAAWAAAWGASNHTPAPAEQSYRVVQEGIERRAVNYARDGDLGRAAKALLPQRKAIASASTLEELQQKHPAVLVPIVSPTRDEHDCSGWQYFTSSYG
jgi:hypothetical protein